MIIIFFILITKKRDRTLAKIMYIICNLSAPKIYAAFSLISVTHFVPLVQSVSIFGHFCFLSKGRNTYTHIQFDN